MNTTTWTNWDTRNTYLWLTSHVGRAALDYCDGATLSRLFGEFCTAPRPVVLAGKPASGYTADIDGIDPAQVNWAEVFEALHDGETAHDQVAS